MKKKVTRSEIDADAFIEENKDIIDCEIDHPKYQDTLRDLINNAPTVEARQHGEWIPCSERLPDKEGNYLVSGKWASGKLAVDSCEYKIDYDGGYFRVSHSFDVLAWMPLPNPYKRGEEK